jgi:hydroxymethylpyrimidine pyrophosphatase-like HAD family hydrolase
MTKLFLFDIDGTLANIEHRRAYVQTKPKNWPAFNRAMVHDTAYDDIIWLAQNFYEQGHTIVICSGRGAENKDVTVKWLDDNDIKFHGLYMRPIHDSRRDDIIKFELLEEIRKDYGEPFMVFDDRDQVVNMWRQNGIRCLQVAPGNF